MNNTIQLEVPNIDENTLVVCDGCGKETFIPHAETGDPADLGFDDFSMALLTALPKRGWATSIDEDHCPKCVKLTRNTAVSPRLTTSHGFDTRPRAGYVRRVEVSLFGGL